MTLDQAEESLLEARGIPVHRANGRAPDGNHIEEGVAGILDIEVAAEISREFRQTAFFWYDSWDFYIVGSDEPAERMQLPSTYTRASSIHQHPRVSRRERG